jgi:hypothetical protein
MNKRSKRKTVHGDVDGLRPTRGEIEDAGLSRATASPVQSSRSPTGLIVKTAAREKADDGGRDGDGPGGGHSSGDRVDLLEAWADKSDDVDAPIPLIRLDENEIPLIPFSSQGIMVQLHYCKEAEIQGYVRCNGTDCLLCRVGRKREDRYLLPVYAPTSRSVGVLAISSSSRPGALRPQLMPSLRSGRRAVWLIRRLDRVAFRVTTVDLKDGIDDGAEIIADFLGRLKAGRVDLQAVYQRLDDRDLAEVPGVASMMRIKGIQL